MADTKTHEENRFGYGDVSNVNDETVFHVQRNNGGGAWVDAAVSLNELRRVLGIPKQLVFVLSQDGTNDPNLIRVLKNDFNAVGITPERIDLGVYEVTFGASVLNATNTFVHFGATMMDTSQAPHLTGDVQWLIKSGTVLEINTLDVFLQLSDGILNQTMVTVSVFDWI